MAGEQQLSPGKHPATEFGFDPSKCKGVFIGGCVGGDGTGRPFHVHYRRQPKTYRWICVPDAGAALNSEGGPSAGVVAGYAFLVSGARQRTAKWAAVVRDFGYPSEADLWQISATAPRYVLGNRWASSLPKTRLEAIFAEELETPIEREMARELVGESEETLDDFLTMVKKACWVHPEQPPG
jgi:hypothetical protein